MSLIADRVVETWAGTGTGTMSLAGAQAGFQAFSDAFSNADEVFYVITQGTTDWEIGTGTLTTGVPDMLSRDTVLQSSNADALVNFGSGTKSVFCGPPAGFLDATLGEKHTIWIPAAAMRPTVSNGCDAVVDVETTAGQPDMQVLDFDTTVDEHAQFQIAFPKSWNEGTVTFRAYWTVAAAVTTGVAWALQGVAVSDDDTIDVAYGTAVVVTDDALNAAEDLMVTDESTAVTIAGTPAAADQCFFRLFRDVSDANDDMTQDARLLGVQVFYTINARDDT
jgi:hypothetical protein